MLSKNRQLMKPLCQQVLTLQHMRPLVARDPYNTFQQYLWPLTFTTRATISKTNTNDMALNTMPSTTSSSAIRPITSHSFPPEILENIASFRAKNGLLSIRLTNHYLAENTTDVFAASFLHGITLPDSCSGSSDQTLAGIISRPDWASKVRKMNIQLPFEGTFHLPGALSLLPNLNTLQIDIFAENPDDFKLFFA